MNWNLLKKFAANLFRKNNETVFAFSIATQIKQIFSENILPINNRRS